MVHGDGAVDLLDLDLLSIDFVADPSAAAPEPGAVLLAMTGLGLIKRRRRLS